ncbi:hypothetical protein BACI71_20103 [Bacillus mycoides]|uniref:Uncharacterized protein n=1 Tax=Bacillus mycoides TaxID=1405 RepID=A0A653VAK4_BACMY|nr:hypothetical protein BACI71_20103 [Bacillus mycoides]
MKKNQLFLKRNQLLFKRNQLLQSNVDILGFQHLFVIGEHLLKRTKESYYSELYKIINEKVQSTVVNTEAVLFVMLV